jgi:hypothetical protein
MASFEESPPTPIYPIFTRYSIIVRYKLDIAKFKLDNSITQIDIDVLRLDIEHVKYDNDSLIKSIKAIVGYIDAVIYDYISSSENKHLSSLDTNDKTYVNVIVFIDNITIQQKLWIARTYLFYQILIFTTFLLENNTAYDDFFSPNGPINDLQKINFPFRNDIINELPNFKMINLGSMTATSDIDLGIQYYGNIMEKHNDQYTYQGGLAYIVSTIESVYVKLTNKPRGSLDYDIETYADMMTLPNTGKDKNEHPDFFYLDSSKFYKNDFVKVLECAWKSIARNAILAYMDESIDESIDKTYITNKLTELTLSKIIQTLEAIHIYEPVENTKNKKTYEVKHSLTELSENYEIVNNDSNTFEQAKKDMYDFLKKTYTEQRYEYYTKVAEAENIKLAKLREVKNSLNDLTSGVIAEIMKSIGDSLSYRMESHTCAPTIVHVVRTLQASQDNDFLKHKYLTFCPKKMCDNKIISLKEPKCNIGKYGYALSILEQIGYMYRFYLTYCIKGTSHYHYEKCKKKKIKYIDRYNNAFDEIDLLNGLGEACATTVGGKKSKTRKNRKYQKIQRTLKHKNTHKSRRTQKTRRIRRYN